MTTASDITALHKKGSGLTSNRNVAEVGPPVREKGPQDTRKLRTNAVSPRRARWGDINHEVWNNVSSLHSFPTANMVAISMTLPQRFADEET